MKNREEDAREEGETDRERGECMGGGTAGRRDRRVKYEGGGRPGGMGRSDADVNAF